MTTTELPPEHAAHASTPVAATPETIMQIASGFMAAKHLFAASALGLFEALAESAASLDGLAARVGLTRRSTRISADAMVALGLLERTGDLYRNTPVAAAFLTGQDGADLRPLLRFWDQISYPAWLGFTDALASGPSSQVFDLDAASQSVVSAGIEAALAAPSEKFGRTEHLGGRRSLLDVGGGTGSWSIAAVRNHDGLRATVLELPVTAAIARDRLARSDHAERVVAVDGDALTDELPIGHDAFLLANVLHYYRPTDNIRLLERVRTVSPSNGLLLLADFWTDPTHTAPLPAALMAGEFAVHLEHGDVYSVEEVRSWLDATGWDYVEHRSLAGAQSLIIATAGA